MQEALGPSHHNKDGFMDVASQLFKKSHNQDAFQCQIKSKQLMRTYIKTRDGRKLSGRGYITYPFFEEVDRILHS